ncbi:MAG TPA: glycoside hydrolase family 75 protein [Polyangiaceae bacterium]|nr:glycoside hydrolase family 75 protein [Polyangiaceae bacterium]
MRTIAGCAWAFVLGLGALGACSSSEPSSSDSSAGASSLAGSSAHGGGGSSAQAGSTSASGGSTISSAGNTGSGGSATSSAGNLGSGGATSNGGTGGSATNGGAGGSNNGGSAGSSANGGASNAGSGGSTGSGLGGMTNDLGTITGSPVIAQLLALTQNCTTANQIPNSHTYKLDNGSSTSICSLKGGTGNAGGAIYYTADMDIDCDGLTTTHCPGTGADMDCCYQDETSFHGPNSASDKDGPQLASENTPYVVVPQDVQFPGLDQNNGGNIVAVIYNNQLEFGVFGDQGPSDIIGEASVRTANGLGIPSSPASGGVGSGVTYIVFVGAGSQPQDMENIPQIQALGAQLVEALLANDH